MKNKILLALASLILAVGGGIGLYFILDESGSSDESQTQQEQAVNELQIPVEIIYDDEDTLKFELKTEGEETVFNALKMYAQENEDFEFEYVDYGADLGAAPVSFNDYVIDQETEWWKFMVNGEMSNLGISSYQLSEGDEIKFLREAF